MKTYAVAIAAAMTVLSLAASVHAEDKVSCTTESQDKWLTEDAVTAKLLEGGFQSVRSIKVEGEGCYEVKAIDKDGNKAEIYVNPMTAEIQQPENDGDE